MSDTTLGMLVLATPVVAILLAVKPSRRLIVTAVRTVMRLTAAVLMLAALALSGPDVRRDFGTSFREHAAATRPKAAYRTAVTPRHTETPGPRRQRRTDDDMYTPEWYDRAYS